MPSADRKGPVPSRGLRRVIADESFTIALFAAVGTTTAFAFGLGATADIVASMLIMGLATAFAEARLRTRK
jgi:hypothetical protein